MRVSTESGETHFARRQEPRRSGRLRRDSAHGVAAARGLRVADQRPSIEGGAIVLIGSFNPAIIQPYWLASVDLIRRDEAGSATVDVISQQVTSFSISWLALQVLESRFQAESTDPAHHLHLLNLVEGIFANLDHTPFSKMGILRRAHYQLPSEDEWHTLGDRLAPKELWRSVMSSPIREDTPGLRTITIEGCREGSPAAWMRVKVEPSVKLSHGVYIEVYEHHDEEESGGDAARILLGILHDGWERFLRDATSIADGVLSWTERSRTHG